MSKLFLLLFAVFIGYLCSFASHAVPTGEPFKRQPRALDRIADVLERGVVIYEISSVD
jgi:hypothetical protein